VNGTDVGATPMEEPLILDPGRHIIVITKPGYEPLELTVTAASGAEVTIRADLQETPDPADANSGLSDSSYMATGRYFDSGLRPLMITGFGLGALGLASGIAGAVFAVKFSGNKDYYENVMEEAAEAGDEDKYNEAWSRYKAQRAGMIIGFVGAGVLLAASATVFVIDVLKFKKEKEKSHIAIRPTLGGLMVTF